MSTSERFTFTEPALCHYGHDLRKAWFLYFTITDNVSAQKHRFQYRRNINSGRTVNSRLRNAKIIQDGLLSALQRGWNPADVHHIHPINYRLDQSFEKMLAIKLPTLKKRAKETYTYVVKLFRAWLAANHYTQLPLKDFSKQMATDYLDYLKNEKKYANRTHNDHLIVLKLFFNQMIAKEWVLKSPFKDISFLEVSVGRNVAYSDNERELLNKHLYNNDRRLYYFTQIMYYCFIRRSELAQLRVQDFDLINHTITIPAGIAKNKSQESVVIPLGLEPILKEMEFDKYLPTDFVFGRKMITCSTPYLNYNHISTRHNKYVRELKISKEKGLYSHKHTGVIRAYYATGKDIYAVMRQLRHRSLETSMVYLKSLGLIQNDVLRNAMVA